MQRVQAEELHDHEEQEDQYGEAGAFEILPLLPQASREELVSKLLFVMQSPLRRLVTVLNGPVRNLAGVVSQIADQKSKSGPADAAPAS